MKLLLKYVRRYKIVVILALSLAAVEQTFTNLIPYIIGHKLIDPLTSNVHYFKDHGKGMAFFYQVATGIFMILGAGALSLLASAYRVYATNIIVRRFGADLYSDVQSHVLNISYNEMEGQRSGEVLAALQRVRSDSENFIHRFIGVTFSILVAFTMVTVISFSISPYLPLLYWVCAILISVVIGHLTKKMKVVQQDILNDSNALMGAATESIRNLELIKCLGLVKQEALRFNRANFRILGRELIKIKSIRSVHLFYGVTVLFLQTAIISLLLVLMFYGRLTVGQFIMMHLYYYALFATLADLGNVIVFFRDVQVSLGDIQKIFDRPQQRQVAHPEKIGHLKHLRFEKVNFRHQSSVLPVLENISLEIKMGETVALVGPSGAGKTTLIKLLLGLYNPGSGRIYYNGRAHEKVNIDEFRSQVGLVTQDAQLFSGTIKENLHFVNPAADDAMLESALRTACCNEMLKRAHNGIDTMIGESGLRLSGGERQRLAIARALVRDGNILIFDEATSALDSITEKSIADMIREIIEQKQYITILIAHRLSTVVGADRIYVLDQGRIIETGDHMTLLENRGLYYAMWKEQVGALSNA